MTFGPDSLIIAIAPTPGAVESAIMLSDCTMAAKLTIISSVTFYPNLLPISTSIKKNHDYGNC